jgi:DNA-binding CsgD family transcriptional regulator
MTSFGAELLGRGDECQALDDLVTRVRAGRSATLVLRGEAGIGKTELLRYVGERATGCRIVTAAGVQSEMEISYAGLHQLCGPLLAGIEHLPGPQRDALSTTFGLRGGAVPDRFMVGLATLSLLAEACQDQPLVCLVDDAQWLDQASALTLAFVARRLLAEAVLIVFAVRVPSTGESLAGLPELFVPGLSERDSRTLLDGAVAGPLDDQVRDRIVAEAHGNPLALLELPRGWDAAEIAGFARPGSRPVAGEIEEGFLRRVEALPAEARRLLVAAAAEPVGDGMLLRRAAERLGIVVDAALERAEASELVTVGARVRFRHPLVRSAAYRASDPRSLREIHQALAEATDARLDPDRRVWHLARAAEGPNEEVAAELERSAGRARARGGVAAAAAFLQNAAELTEEPVRRTRRTVDAAQATVHSGAFGLAAALLTRAETGPPDELLRARIDVLRAQIAFAQGRSKEAPPLLLAAARRLEPLDVPLARETHLEAVSAVIFAGHLARSPGWREVGETARSAPPAPLPSASDMLLDALAVRLTDGYAASAPMIEEVLGVLCDEGVPVEEAMRRLLLAGVIAADLWDLDRWRLVATRHVTVARETGALSELPLALDSRAVVHVFAGELAAAASVIEEVRTVSAAIGSNQPPFGALALAAVRGHEREARTLIDRTVSGAAQYGQGLGVTVAHCHHAVLCNGLAQYEEAVTAARAAVRHQEEFGAPRWALTELVEAATHSGDQELASDALEQLSVTTQASGSDWALGVEARSRALLSDGEAAESLYRDAIERLGRTQVRVELARTRLVYGEWLRRENRRLDAREQLGIAHQMLTQLGAEAFAERARRELQATGATVRKRTAATPTSLTSQEAQIARLAADGLTNPEIGAHLFLSRHTVEWHLRNVFSKLGITSRREIRNAAFQGAAP